MAMADKEKASTDQQQHILSFAAAEPQRQHSGIALKLSESLQAYAHCNEQACVALNVCAEEAHGFLSLIDKTVGGVEPRDKRRRVDVKTEDQSAPAGSGQAAGVHEVAEAASKDKGKGKQSGKPPQATPAAAIAAAKRGEETKCTCPRKWISQMERQLVDKKDEEEKNKAQEEADIALKLSESFQQYAAAAAEKEIAEDAKNKAASEAAEKSK